MDDFLDGFLNFFKKPIIIIVLVVLVLLTGVSSFFKFQVDTVMEEYTTGIEIRRLQLTYCDSFFSRAAEKMVKQFSDLPAYQIRYCVLKCKYDMAVRLQFSKIENVDAYIENLTLSFLNLIWSDAFDERVNSDSFKLYIKDSCKELVTTLYQIQES